MRWTMIVTENLVREDGVKLIRTYSDEGKRIIQNETGILTAWSANKEEV